MSKIGFIGTGNMGGALARAVAKTGANVYLFDADTVKASKLAQELGENAIVSSAEALISECDAVFLGVKPQMLEVLSEQIAPFIQKRQSHICFISMAAGKSIEYIDDLFCKNARSASVIRIMPNTPVAVGEGMILYCASANTTENDISLFLDIMKYAGKLDSIPEKLIDAASAVSGCGPAFVCMFIEALADGGVLCGLPRDKAMTYAIQTLKGTAELLSESGKHPGELKDAVCSPAGTTIRGVAALEAGGFRASAINAVTEAYNRTLEL